jgi:thioredoxin 1
MVHAKSLTLSLQSCTKTDTIFLYGYGHGFRRFLVSRKFFLFLIVFCFFGLTACSKGPATSNADTPAATAAAPAAAPATQPTQSASGEPTSANTPTSDKATQSTQASPVSQPEKSAHASQAETSSKKGTLLFFMNPAGAPCQYQDQILNQIAEKLNQKVSVVSVRTDIFGDRPVFGQYGIRALPTLILLDENQKEVLRFPPGIQQPEIILQALNKI